MRRLAAVLVVSLYACKCEEKVGKPPAPPAPPPQAEHSATPVAEAQRALPKREPVGGGLNANPKMSAGTASLQLGADGLPVIAWHENNAIEARRWTGTTWEPLGGGQADQGRKRAAGIPQLSVAADGAVWAGWTEYDERDVARGRVAKLEGAAWKDVGAPLGAKQPVHAFAFTARTSAPVFAFTEAEGDKYRLHVRALAAGAWAPLGADPLVVNEAANVLQPPAVAAGRGGAPVVAWLEKEPGKVLAHLRRWDGKAWDPLPALEEGVADSDTSLGLAGAPDGTLTLWLSWNAGLRPLRQLAPDGAAWTVLSLPPKAERSGSLTRVSATGASLALSWSDGRMKLARWDGKAWQPLDEEVFSGWGNPVPVALAADGKVYAAWQDTGPEGGDSAQLKVAVWK